jgi:hypothetical protein
MSSAAPPPFDVFQRGLVRGAERLAYDPAKRYFYVESVKEGWRVYLRAACFIYEKPARASSESASGLGREHIYEKPLKGQCIDPMRFLVVKRAGKPATGREWEPPKGQMEGKDGLRDPKDSIMDILRENVKREVGEEARIHNLQGLEHTGLVFQGREPDYPPNHFFQYHIFRALVTTREWMRASGELEWYREHPAAFARLRRDKREKDAITWYNPSETQLMGKWSPKIVAMALAHFTKGN